MGRDLIRGTMEVRLAIEYHGNGDAIVHVGSGTFKENESRSQTYDTEIQCFVSPNNYKMIKGVFDDESEKALLEEYGIMGLQIEKYARRLLVEEIFKWEWEKEPCMK